MILAPIPESPFDGKVAIAIWPLGTSVYDSIIFGLGTSVYDSILFGLS
jgi:hypothetical protein